jgi:hypothetical protein
MLSRSLRLAGRASGEQSNACLSHRRASKMMQIGSQASNMMHADELSLCQAQQSDACQDVLNACMQPYDWDAEPQPQISWARFW